MNRRKFMINASMGTAGIALLRKGNHVMAGSVFPSQNITNNVALIMLNPIDNGKALINPDMGWTMHFYSNIIDNYGSKLAPSDTLDNFPGLSTVYLRLPWSFIEPEEGKFNWEILDTPAQRWINKGKKVAFRITAGESWMCWASPEWVAKSGAKGYNWGNEGRLWEPAFDDPIFLEKVDLFLSEMASRYDGNPNVAFIDVGHFGLWGEGHTVVSTKIDYDISVKKQIIDLYCKYFKKTLLCISDDFAGHNMPGDRFPITDYAFSKGVTMRDDSILVQPPPRSWYHSEMAQMFWPTLPVILEHEHYGASIRNGAWRKDLLLKSVEDYHASYMSIHWWPEILLKENLDVIEKINIRMGYRLQIRSISWPEKIKLGEPFIISYSWANAGVAPCYPGGYPCITLKDDSGGIISVLTDESFNVKELQIAEPQKAKAKEVSLSLVIAPAYNDPIKTFYRGVKPGKYHLYVSVGNKEGTPVFQLPYDENDGHNRYKFGQIEIIERS